MMDSFFFFILFVIIALATWNRLASEMVNVVISGQKLVRSDNYRLSKIKH